METLKIGILGSGQVAKVLATGFLRHGHQVKIGSRDPKKFEEWKAKSPGVQPGTFEEAA
ncbi:MAG TPA: NAD(P)-binding domain-containing protein, partial [Cyclobacteriaceae bacterium]|nr:NAD(P)-binding domain-containing protein [Cyclobacteriaceae bacterium]